METLSAHLLPALPHYTAQFYPVPTSTATFAAPSPFGIINPHAAFTNPHTPSPTPPSLQSSTGNTPATASKSFTTPRSSPRTPPRKTKKRSPASPSPAKHPKPASPTARNQETLHGPGVTISRSQLPKETEEMLGRMMMQARNEAEKTKVLRYWAVCEERERRERVKRAKKEKKRRGKVAGMVDGLGEMMRSVCV